MHSSPSIAKSPANNATLKSIQTLKNRDLTINSLRTTLGSPAKPSGDLQHYQAMSTATLARLIKARDSTITILRKRVEENKSIKPSQDLISESEVVPANPQAGDSDDEYDKEFEDVSPFV